MKHKTTGSLVKKKKTAEHYNQEKRISLFSFLSIWIFCKMFRKKNKHNFVKSSEIFQPPAIPISQHKRQLNS